MDEQSRGYGTSMRIRNDAMQDWISHIMAETSSTYVPNPNAAAGFSLAYEIPAEPSRLPYMAAVEPWMIQVGDRQLWMVGMRLDGSRFYFKAGEDYFYEPRYGGNLVLTDTGQHLLSRQRAIVDIHGRYYPPLSRKR